jgi:hypothetical protein
MNPWTIQRSYGESDQKAASDAIEILRESGIPACLRTNPSLSELSGLYHLNRYLVEIDDPRRDAIESVLDAIEEEFHRALLRSVRARETPCKEARDLYRGIQAGPHERTKARNFVECIRQSNSMSCVV